jgi:hypothetical protein
MMFLPVDPAIREKVISAYLAGKGRDPLNEGRAYLYEISNERCLRSAEDCKIKGRQGR